MENLQFEVEISRSEEIKEFATALAKLQGELPILQKRTQGYDYKYADLVEIAECTQEPLSRHGFSIISQPSWGEFPKIKSTLLHSSGQWMTATIRLEYTTGVKIDKYGKEKQINAMQAMGSAITYARRYASICLLNLAADKESDDDGEKSSPDKKNHFITPEMAKEIMDLLKDHEEIKKNLQKSCKTIDKIPLENFIDVKNWILKKIKDKSNAGN